MTPPDIQPVSGLMESRGVLSRHSFTLFQLVLRTAQRGAEPFSRGYLEFGEDLPQMPFDRSRADEQPTADFRVGEAVTGQERDLSLLLRQLVVGVDGTFADDLSCRNQLAARTF